MRRHAVDARHEHVRPARRPAAGGERRVAVEQRPRAQGEEVEELEAVGRRLGPDRRGREHRPQPGVLEVDERGEDAAVALAREPLGGCGDVDVRPVLGGDRDEMGRAAGLRAPQHLGVGRVAREHGDAALAQAGDPRVGLVAVDEDHPAARIVQRGRDAEALVAQPDHDDVVAGEEADRQQPGLLAEQRQEGGEGGVAEDQGAEQPCDLELPRHRGLDGAGQAEQADRPVEGVERAEVRVVAVRLVELEVADRAEDDHREARDDHRHGAGVAPERAQPVTPQAPDAIGHHGAHGNRRRGGTAAQPTGSGCGARMPRPCPSP